MPPFASQMLGSPAWVSITGRVGSSRRKAARRRVFHGGCDRLTIGVVFRS